MANLRKTTLKNHITIAWKERIRPATEWEGPWISPLPDPVSSAVRALCAGFNGFGLDLHRGLPSGGNTFISPLSLGAALAALILGARGQTAAELVRVLGLQGTAEDTARSMAELRRILEPRKTEEETWND